MKNYIATSIFVLFSLVISVNSYGQIDKIRDSLVAEGRMLYKSELASWYGTDLFLEKYNNMDNIGGYFSYVESDTINNIFFSKGMSPKVIGMISFDSTLNIKAAEIDLNERSFTKIEEDYYIIRERALLLIRADTFFKSYQKTSFNLIPLISNGEKKVYVITGSKDNSHMVFGNDYLLNFDDRSNYTSKKQLHKSILWTKYGDDIYAAYHTHTTETSDFITPTDICTLMLYEKIAKWKEYVVIGPKYFSIWNCLTNELVILTKEDAAKYYGQKRSNENDE